MARVRITIDKAAAVRLVTRTTDAMAHNAARAVQRRAQVYAPYRTGALVASITVTKVRGGQRTTYVVSPHVPYATYQEFGTGPIFPKRPGGVLVWTARTGEVVFARHTRGVPAVHFMQRAAMKTTINDFRLSWADRLGR